MAEQYAFPPARMGREMAAYFLQESVREIDELRSQGEITARGRKDAKRVHFNTADLLAYVERQPERHK